MWHTIDTLSMGTLTIMWFHTLAVAYCVNADAYCTKSDVDAASNTADKAEEPLFVDANSVLNREAP